jgi:hypothetical protein
VPSHSRERALEGALLHLYEQWKSLGYRAGRLYQVFMPHCKRYKGGIAAVRSVIYRTDVTAGFAFLVAKKRTDLSIEALVLKPEWNDVFTDLDRALARSKLKNSK